MQFMDAVLPLVSVLLGAAITYLLNVRTRRATKAVDAFHDAIAAVAKVVASRDYVTGPGQWFKQSSDEAEEFQRELGREAHWRFVRCVGNGRAAVARASAYDPGLHQFVLLPPGEFADHSEEVLRRLRHDLGGDLGRGSVG